MLACLCLYACADGVATNVQPDPVSGEMVMSTAYHFDLKNGQRLRFATHDTLAQFLEDPVRLCFESFAHAHVSLCVVHMMVPCARSLVCLLLACCACCSLTHSHLMLSRSVDGMT